MQNKLLTYSRMENTNTMQCDGGTCAPQQTCEGSCDQYFDLSEDAKFGTLLMLLPALTLSFFNMAGLL
jgi:hypothetical protein